MIDASIEYGTYCFSGLAVVKHTKEAFIAANKKRTFQNKSEEDTEVLLSEIYDKAVIAIEAANPTFKKSIPVVEPIVENEIIDNTEDKERGVLGTSASKRIRKNKG